MTFVSNFKDLEVYKLARKLQNEIFEVSKRFPKEEMYSLTDQIRRASRSVGSQIAEAWGKRRYEAHFISKLTDADSEQLEMQHWVETAHDCKYISQEERNYFINQYSQVGKMLYSMMNKASSFGLNISSDSRQGAVSSRQ